MIVMLALQVCSTTHHPGYNRFTNQHDLAILRLCHPVTLDQASVAPACLPAAAGPGYEGVEVRVILTMVSTLYTSRARPWCPAGARSAQGAASPRS